MLQELLAPRSIVERSEGGVRAEEGLPGERRLLAGVDPEVPLVIDEGDMRFLVDVLHGQKAGFFLDQRETRALVRRLSAGRRVLNAFAYTGALSVAAAVVGVLVTAMAFMAAPIYSRIAGRPTPDEEYVEPVVVEKMTGVDQQEWEQGQIGQKLG